LNSCPQWLGVAVVAFQKDLFWYERNWEEFERVFERYRRADLSKADPKAVAGIVAIDKWMTRNQQAIELVLTSPHWPRDLTPLEEHLHTVQSRLGDRRRLFRNPYRLNCVLRLMLMQLRGSCSVQSWARILGENHRHHDGKPPPRRHWDGNDLFRIR
jgi:hypothetical protein